MLCLWQVTMHSQAYWNSGGYFFWLERSCIVCCNGYAGTCAPATGWSVWVWTHNSGCCSNHHVIIICCTPLFTGHHFNWQQLLQMLTQNHTSACFGGFSQNPISKDCGIQSVRTSQQRRAAPIWGRQSSETGRKLSQNVTNSTIRCLVQSFPKQNARSKKWPELNE